MRSKHRQFVILSFSVSFSYIMVIAKNMVKGDFRGDFKRNLLLLKDMKE